MQTFTYENSIYKGDTKVVHVFDDNQGETGSVQRVYRNDFQQVSDFIFGSNLIVNAKAFGVHDELACEINEVVSRETLMKS